MPKRYPPMYELEDGWCEWVAPLTDYRMMCCDCGLVHELQFRIAQQTGPERKDGTWPARTPRTKNLRVVFRARRDKRATANTRRRKRPPIK